MWEDVDKLRLFPIEPDVRRLIHVNYSLQIEPLTDDDQKPLMPVDNRWILVHHALGVWHATNGSGSMADREFAIANKMLAEMREEHHKTDVVPKFVVRKGKYVRRHMTDYDRDKFIMARRLET